jgi:Flp pilus assembly pilin Flp
MLSKQIKAFFDDQSGQGITEYGAVIAFVGMMLAIVFSAGHGALTGAIQSSFSAVSQNLNQLITTPS